jgi:hypothetical protein
MSKRLITGEPLTQPRQGAPGMRGAIDSLVQGSLVELFGAYGVAVAPLPRSIAQGVTIPDMSVAVSFHYAGERGRTGRLSLSMSSQLLDSMKASESRSVKTDWARELANQLMGRIKNRLLPFNVRIDVGSLTTLESNMLERQVRATPALRVYLARALRGDVVATLGGLPDDRELTYVGSPSAAEGTLILF